MARRASSILSTRRPTASDVHRVAPAWSGPAGAESRAGAARAASPPISESFSTSRYHRSIRSRSRCCSVLPEAERQRHRLVDERRDVLRALARHEVGDALEVHRRALFVRPERPARAALRQRRGCRRPLARRNPASGPPGAPPRSVSFERLANGIFWQREITVAGSAFGLEVVRTMTVLSGGSSSVLSSVLAASVVIMSASATTKTFHGPM